MAPQADPRAYEDAAGATLPDHPTFRSQSAPPSRRYTICSTARRHLFGLFMASKDIYKTPEYLKGGVLPRKSPVGGPLSFTTPMRRRSLFNRIDENRMSHSTVAAYVAAGYVPKEFARARGFLEEKYRGRYIGLSPSHVSDIDPGQPADSDAMRLAWRFRKEWGGEAHLKAGALHATSAPPDAWGGADKGAGGGLFPRTLGRTKAPPAFSDSAIPNAVSASTASAPLPAPVPDRKSVV